MESPPIVDLFAPHRRIAVDTAPLIYFLEGDEPRSSIVRQLLLGATQKRYLLVVSAVTEAELLVAPMRTRDETAKSAVAALLDGEAVSDVAIMSRQVARRAAKIRAEANLRLPDAIVAATGIEAGCSALVGNDLKFKAMKQEITYLHLDDLVRQAGGFSLEPS